MSDDYRLTPIERAEAIAASQVLEHVLGRDRKWHRRRVWVGDWMMVRIWRPWKLSRCPECEVAPFQFHLVGCVLERCAYCGELPDSCRCNSQEAVE